jgi:hypothetical protein
MGIPDRVAFFEAGSEGKEDGGRRVGIGRESVIMGPVLILFRGSALLMLSGGRSKGTFAPVRCQ